MEYRSRGLANDLPTCCDRWRDCKGVDGGWDDVDVGSRAVGREGAGVSCRIVRHGDGLVTPSSHPPQAHLSYSSASS